MRHFFSLVVAKLSISPCGRCPGYFFLCEAGASWQRLGESWGQPRFWSSHFLLLSAHNRVCAGGVLVSVSERRLRGLERFRGPPGCAEKAGGQGGHREGGCSHPTFPPHRLSLEGAGSSPWFVSAGLTQ